MLIAQISDSHLVAPGRLAYGRVDTGAMLAKALEVLKSLPRLPDLVLATGDLAAEGEDAEYGAFVSMTSDLGIPFLPVVGNHDHRSRLAAAFDLIGRFELQPGFIQYAVEGFPVRLLILDSTTAGGPQPSLCAARLSWIEARLAEDSRPTIIALHHPPFPAGVAWMEPKDRDWAKRLEQLVAHHPQMLRVVCGHAHRAMTAPWAGTIAMSAPSTAHQVYLDMAPSPIPRFSVEAPGLLLHEWTGKHMISYGVTIPGFADTFEV